MIKKGLQIFATASKPLFLQG
jgi:glutaryl-CoA dehydrogenase